MEFRQLKYFIAVAEERSFRRAAERLHISQPPVSQQIIKLEMELGVKLLNRTSREVSLTPAGATLLQEARIVVASVDGLGARVRSSANPVLRVAYLEVTGSPILSRILRKVKTCHPEIELVLEALPANEHAVALRSGHVDAALGLLPLPSKDFDSLPIVTERLMIAMSAWSTLAKREVITADDLGNVQEIIGAEAAGHGSINGHSEGIAHGDPGLSLLSGGQSPSAAVAAVTQTTLDLVAAGYGVTAVPELTARLFNRGAIAYRPLEPPTAVTWGLSWPHMRPSSNLTLLLDVVQGMIETEQFTPTIPTDALSFGIETLNP